MASTVRTCILLVLAALICSHAPTGNPMQYGDACLLSDIHISTVRTGKFVVELPQYRVTIENRCECPQDTVRVQCDRLPSTETVNTTMIAVQYDGSCLVNNGELIFRASPVVFTYAWKEPLVFTPMFAITLCPGA